MLDKRSYSVGLDVTLDDFSRRGIHSYGARAVDGVVCDDGLRVDAWEGFGGF